MICCCLGLVYGSFAPNIEYISLEEKRRNVRETVCLRVGTYMKADDILKFPAWKRRVFCVPTTPQPRPRCKHEVSFHSSVGLLIVPGLGKSPESPESLVPRLRRLRKNDAFAGSLLFARTVGTEQLSSIGVGVRSRSKEDSISIWHLRIFAG